MEDWLKDHKNIDELANDLMHKINQRNQYPSNTQPFAKSDLHVKDLYRNFKQKVGQLQELLDNLTASKRITQRESERRQRLVNNLNDRCKQIEILINNPNSDKRNSLLSYNNYQSIGSTNHNDTPVVGWNDLDMEQGTSNSVSVTDLRETQKLLMKEQDKNLDTLSSIITRQKYLSKEISSEIDLHNEILEDITDALEETDERLTRNTRNIRVVDKKSNTCGYWIVILLLLVAIIVAGIVPT